MKLIDIGEGLTSAKIKVNEHLYGCICNSVVAQSIFILWNGDVIVNNNKIIVSKSEDKTVELICVIDDSLKNEEIYTLD